MTCTPETHQAVTADVVEAVAVLVDLRAWPDAGLMLGRCVACGSHLSLPLDEAVEALHRRDPLAAGGAR